MMRMSEGVLWCGNKDYNCTDQKINYHSSADLLRIPEKCQKYRYAKNTQLFLDIKKYRYVGEICKCTFIILMLINILPDVVEYINLWSLKNQPLIQYHY